jgi:hypothetical protein
MSGGEDRALTSQLSAQVLAAMAEVADSDRPAVHALASSIRETIVKGEILMPGLGQLALSLACLQFQEQPTAAAPAGDTAPGMTASEVNGAVRKEIQDLATAVRAQAGALTDRSHDLQEDIPSDLHRLTRNVAELALVLARVLEGKPILRAFGAPGDWGYGTPMGEAVYTAIANVTGSAA